MAKKKAAKTLKPSRAERLRLTEEESLKRMQDFPKRREQFIAAIRKSKNRGVSA
jgi:hypothetical protein